MVDKRTYNIIVWNESVKNHFEKTSQVAKDYKAAIYFDLMEVGANHCGKFQKMSQSDILFWLSYLCKVSFSTLQE